MTKAQEDPNAEDEPRWILLGMSTKQRLLSGVYTLRYKDRIRLIAAREATRREATQHA